MAKMAKTAEIAHKPRKIAARYVKKAEIQKYFIGPQMILRSQMKIIRESKVNLRECFVAIERNYAAVSMDWLNRRVPSRGLVKSPATGSSNATAATIQPVPLRERRASVASCGNMFEVDGLVTEVGFDYLARIPRQNTIIGLQPKPVNELDDLDVSASSALESADVNIADERDGINNDSTNRASAEQADIEKASNAESAKKHADVNNTGASSGAHSSDSNDPKPVNEFGELDELNVSALSALESTDVNIADECDGINNDSTNRASIAIQYDPFVRARNVPFRVANRRRSISVFTDLTPLEIIYENPVNPQEPHNKEN